MAKKNMRKIFVILLLAVPVVTLAQQRRAEQRNLINSSITDQDLRLALDKTWTPFPTIHERAAWNNIPEKYKEQYIRAAEQYANKKYEPIYLTDWLAYTRIGNRSIVDKKQNERRTALSVFVLAECMENQGRFIDRIADIVWMILEESSWSTVAHLNIQNKGIGLPDVTDPVVELFAAETAQILAWTYYLLGDRLDAVSPLINQRLFQEIQRRILKPYMSCMYGYLGLDREQVNNWDPWINSNMLTCAMIFEPDNMQRYYLVKKIIASADKFINWYTPDGGCDEGPAYWGRAGRMLFYLLLQFQQITEGKMNIFHESIIENMGLYIAKAYISGNYYVNFADATARLVSEVDPGAIYLWGKKTENLLMQDFGCFLLREEGLNVDFNLPHMGLSLYQLFALNEMSEKQGREPLLLDASLPDIQVFMARSHENSRDGFYLAMKGGHNDESHNHNDVGNFIVYYDGKPLIIDAGRAVYNAKTFSDERYSLWHTQSSYHNCPEINGYMQMAGAQYAASDVKYRHTAKQVLLSMELGKAYPEEAGIETWERSLRFLRNESITVEDKFRMNRKPDTENMIMLLTCLKPQICNDGILLESSGRHRFDRNFKIALSNNLEARIEPLVLTDANFMENWGDTIYRIVLVAPRLLESDTYKITIK